MNKSLSDMVKELELDKKSAKALQCMDAINHYEKTFRPQSKRYWKSEAERLFKELKQMEAGKQ